LIPSVRRQLPKPAVTNACFAALHGLMVGPVSHSTMPVPLRKTRARHERNSVGRISGRLPSAARRRRCAPAPFPPSLRLRFTPSARRPQTEAGLDFIYCEATPIHLALISAVFIPDSLKMLKTP